MFLALYIFDPNNIVARGAMTALSASNNNTILWKLCTQNVLVGYSDSNPVIDGDPEYSLNRVPRQDGAGYMTATERLAFYSDEAQNGIICIPPGHEEKISWG
jgi:hypothetical protein